MNTLSRGAAAATVLLALLSPAAATEPVAGFYAGAFGSLSGPDSRFDYAGGSDDVTYELGGGAGLMVGYAFGNGLRLEVEGAIRQSAVDNVDTSIVLDDGGETRADTLLVNVLYDVDTGTRLTPYVGVGAGLAHVSHGLVRTIAGDSVHDDTYAAAAQAIAGVGYALGDDWRLFADYRLMLTSEASTATGTGTDLDAAFRMQSVNVGLARRF